jgi:hypothetical protein
MTARTYNIGDAFGRTNGNALRGALIRAGNGSGATNLVLLAFRNRWLLNRAQSRIEPNARYMYGESLALAQLRVAGPTVWFLAYDYERQKWVEGCVDSSWEYTLHPAYGSWSRLLTVLVRREMRTPDAVRAYLALGGAQ